MLLQSLPKHSELTYGVHKAVLAEVVSDNAYTIMEPEELLSALKHLDQGAMGAVRALIAKHELLRQGIAYGLVYRVMDTPIYPIVGVESIASKLQFLVYRRNKKNGEGQLSSKFSLGVGGHIEGIDLSYHHVVVKSDYMSTSAVDILETLDDSFEREVSEEVNLFNKFGDNITYDTLHEYTGNKGFNKIGFVMDSSIEHGYVGNTHFGVVYAVDAGPGVDEFEMSEEMNDAVCWATADNLLNDPVFTANDTEFEPWSQMIVDQIKATEEYILKHFVK